MSGHDDKVKRLLDGEIDEEEIASDPVLSSLAERIFGLNIEPITPSKPTQETGLPEVEVVTAKTNLDSMIEVVPGVDLPAPLPMPALPEIPGKGTAKKGGLMKVFGFLALATSIANMFGAFGFLNSQCTVEKCTSEATRINWIDIHNIGNEQGWSLPLPELGIPDYVAVASSLLVLILALRRK